MVRSYRMVVLTALTAASAACASVPPSGGPAPQPGDAAAVARARADSARLPYTEADVRFMTLMIGHHAQALQMAGMAATHGASGEIRTLAGRIVSGQEDEIATMQQWLRDRGRPAPAYQRAYAAGQQTHAGHAAGHDAGHAAQMPGMLSDDQMRQLDAARGPDFDLLFLRYMIQHHRGAVAMVRDLFATHGAGQDETVFRFATDVNVDQTTEIARMEQLLARRVFATEEP